MALCVSALCVSALCVSTLMLAGGTVPAMAAEKDQTAKGEVLVRENCARCHAIGKEGDSPHAEAPPFRTLSSKYPVEDLAESLAEGIVSGHPEMPIFVFEPQDGRPSSTIWSRYRTRPRRLRRKHLPSPRLTRRRQLTSRRNECHARAGGHPVSKLRRGLITGLPGQAGNDNGRELHAASVASGALLRHRALQSFTPD